MQKIFFALYLHQMPWHRTRPVFLHKALKFSLLVFSKACFSSYLISRLFGLTLPHLDTVDDYMRELPDLEFEKVKVNAISSLIRKKVFSSGKFRGHYIVALDGAGIASFDNRL